MEWIDKFYTSLTSIGSRLIGIIFNEDPTIQELFILACSLAIFWGIFFFVGGEIIKPLVSGKKWLLDSFEKEYYREGKKMMEDFGTPASLSEFIDLKIDIWPWTQLVLLQHFIGGLLCVPSIFGLLDTKTASSLACLGIVSEMGWEIEDLISMFYRRIFTKDGKKTVPTIMLIIMPMHHSLTTSLAIPMILSYRNSTILHSICFDLQFASAICLFVGEYTKTLNVSEKPNELFQFRLLTFVGLIIAIWTRGLHWIYLFTQFCFVWYEDKAWTFLIVGCIVGVVFTVFSTFIIILPFYQRFVKFMNISKKHESLPKDASPTKRRESVLSMQAAADELANQISSDPITDIAYYSTIFSNRKVSRRQSVPGYLLQRHKRLSLAPTFRTTHRAASTSSKGNTISLELQKELEQLDKKTD